MDEQIHEINPSQPSYLLQVINAMLHGEVKTVKQEIILPEIGVVDLEAILIEVEQNELDEKA